MRFRTAKIRSFRQVGLFLTLLGIFTMIVSTAPVAFKLDNAWIFTMSGLIFGILIMGGSMAVYFFAGIVSSRIVEIVCPACGRVTPFLGRTDRCAHCHTQLSLDPTPPTDSAE